MARIPVGEEFTRDWDWFAVDDDGCIGHFATAGDLTLPESIRCDWERAEQLLDYFGKAPEVGGWMMCPELPASRIIKGDENILTDPKRREWFFRDFSAMARRGLFSFDREDAVNGYHCIAIPERLLRLESLPSDVQVKLTRLTICFEGTVRISKAVTREW